MFNTLLYYRSTSRLIAIKRFVVHQSDGDVALKACAQVRDLQRGMIIHRLISSRIKTDCYISTSLIHLY
ncbi:unnamed protein product, partial [Rotaria sordida]